MPEDKSFASKSHMRINCPFCDLDEERIVISNDLALAFFDGYPVSKGHALVIPRRHVADYWGLTATEREACHLLLEGLRTHILEKDSDVTGFNLGLNCGESAGQTVFHCHFHLIPRRIGDVKNPRGGIRHVIPDKGHYSLSDPILRS